MKTNAIKNYICKIAETSNVEVSELELLDDATLYEVKVDEIETYALVYDDDDIIFMPADWQSSIEADELFNGDGIEWAVWIDSAHYTPAINLDNMPHII